MSNDLKPVMSISPEFTRQPITMLDGRNNTYITTRMAYQRGSVLLLTGGGEKTRDKNYHLIEERLDNSDVHRMIRFQCKD